MDCFTCVLMGMCMFCTLDLRASDLGRPLTQEEVDQRVEEVVNGFRAKADLEEKNQRLLETQQNRRESYQRRQTFFDDPRYSHMGIGKKSVTTNVDLTHSQNKDGTVAIRQLLNKSFNPLTGNILLLRFPFLKNTNFKPQLLFLASNTRYSKLKERKTGVFSKARTVPYNFSGDVEKGDNIYQPILIVGGKKPKLSKTEIDISAESNQNSGIKHPTNVAENLNKLTETENKELANLFPFLSN